MKVVQFSREYSMELYEKKDGTQQENMKATSSTHLSLVTT